MRPEAEVDLALRLVRWGMNDCEIARLTDIPRRTILDWRHNDGRAGQRPGKRREGFTRAPRIRCPLCSGGLLDRERYAYLLGLYLGDGMLSECPRKVYKLRIVLDARYPRIIESCKEAARHVVTGHAMRIGQVRKIGCYEITGYWKHWPCLFPQHGPGPKFRRSMALVSWQREITSAHPDLLLRGLIHSDGSRDRNVVNGKSYPRYSLSNNSEDIKSIFCTACDQIGVRWTRPNWKSIAVSRRPDVAKLDAVIGPKS
jgi:hypothetical protein